MHLAVVGGGAWLAGALEALLNREQALPDVYISADPSQFDDRCSSEPQMAILVADSTRDEMRAQIARWKRRYPRLRVVVRFRAIRADYVRDAIQAGAWGCFAEDDAPDVVLSLLKSVRNGRMSFPFVDFGTLKDDPFEQLTRREKEVLSALAKGWTNSQISDRLGVSENTVKYHLKLIYDKLGVRNRSMAVAQYLGRENG